MLAVCIVCGAKQTAPCVSWVVVCPRAAPLSNETRSRLVPVLIRSELPHPSRAPVPIMVIMMMVVMVMVMVIIMVVVVMDMVMMVAMMVSQSVSLSVSLSVCCRGGRTRSPAALHLVCAGLLLATKFSAASYAHPPLLSRLAGHACMHLRLCLCHGLHLRRRQGCGLHGRRRRGWACSGVAALRPRLQQRIPRGPPPCLLIASVFATRRSLIA
jgi:hypothetical protein